MVNVLFVHYGGGLGGAPLSLIQLTCGLKSYNYQPEIIFTEFGPILDFAESEGVPVDVVRLPSAFGYGMHVPLRARMLFRWIVGYRSTVRRSLKLMEEKRPELVHLNSSVLLPVARATRKMGIPLVWHVREVPGPNRQIRNWQGRQIVGLADAVIATSQYVRSALPSSERVHVVYNGIDLNGFRIFSSHRRQERTRLGLSQEAPVVLILGNVQQLKGHFFLLQSTRRIIEKIPKARFIVASGGTGPAYRQSWKGRLKNVLKIPIDNRERLRRAARNAGLEDSYLFLDFRKNVAGLLAAADLLVFPSLCPEGFGRPLIEAMAAGLPVVATDIGPTREIVGDRAAHLVEPGDVEGLAATIIRLLENAGQRRDMGERGQARARRMFSLERQLDSIDQIYRSVLSSTR